MTASGNARELVARGAVLLDVRTAEEFEAGHLRGAVHIPCDEIAGRLEELGVAGDTVVVYCRSGRRSARAASALRAAGFVVCDVGAMDAW